MRIFITKEDIVFFGEKIISKGEILKVDNDIYQIKTDSTIIELTINQITKDGRFSEIKERQDFNIKTEELTDEEDIEYKRFRIQLDVTTNRKKLREIEIFMRKTLEDMI